MKISVCMATYNGEKYIKEQLDSILIQLSDSDEVIVSDDGSSDKTIEIIERLNDSRIKIILNKGEKGYTKNFENALKNSDGDIIFLSDQDDVWEKNKVKDMVKELSSYDLVISNAEIVDKDLKLINKSHFDLRGVKRGFWINFLKTRYIGACMAFKGEVLKKVLPFPKNQKLCAHDYWITIVCEAFYKVKLIDQPLIKYRRHGNNASSGGDKSKNTLLKKIRVRLYSGYNLISLKRVNFF